ncbi:hypothetical protein WK15_02030 [Burkholderia ubonensis]|nr:hypothetical protein WK15_02030 [Burkholderia ubonensis]KWC02389.1 hypothetical protein WL45_28755 [Burkholderia ubonensis]
MRDAAASAGVAVSSAASAAPSCPSTVRLVALDTLAERFDVEFVYDGHAVSPVVRQFLAALHATAGA